MFAVAAAAAAAAVVVAVVIAESTATGVMVARFEGSADARCERDVIANGRVVDG